MKTANIRELRNHFPRIAAWIKQGETVEITRNGKRFARLLPAPPEKPKAFKMPDFMARMRENFGDKVFTAEESKQFLDELRRER